jgi:hypothetical protein
MRRVGEALARPLGCRDRVRPVTGSLLELRSMDQTLAAVDAWTDEQVARFLSVSAGHRWAVAFRLGVLYGLRRSEALALKWNDLDTVKETLRIDEGLVAVRTGAAWSRAKNARSRRVIPLDDETVRALARHPTEQAEERLAAGPKWEDHDLIIATHVGRPVMPRSLDRALALLIEEAGLPRLTSHGLRHTAATHMVRGARDVRAPGGRRCPRPLSRHAHERLRPRHAGKHACGGPSDRRPGHCTGGRVVASTPFTWRARAGSALPGRRGWWVAVRCSTSRPAGNATSSAKPEARQAPDSASPWLRSSGVRRCQRWGTT